MSQPYYPQQPYPQPPYPQPQPQRNPVVLILAIVGGVIIGACVLCVGGLAVLGALGSRISTTTQSFGNGTQTTSNNGPAKVGDTITVNNVDCTLVSAAIFHSDNQFEQPKAGNEFVKVNVKIHNGSSSEVSYNEFDFHAKSSAGNITGPEVANAGNNLNSGSLAVGGTASGDVFFQIPIGDHGAQLTWQPNIFGSSDANAWALGV